MGIGGKPKDQVKDSDESEVEDVMAEGFKETNAMGNGDTRPFTGSLTGNGDTRPD